MHKFRLLLLSLCVFTSALHASEDKENSSSNVFGGLGFSKLRRGSVGAPQQKVEDSKVLNGNVADVEKKVDFLNGLVRKHKQENVALEQRVYERLDTTQEQHNQQMSEITKEITGLKTSACKALHRINTKLNSPIIEKVSHDLQPAVNDLALQLKELEEKWQSAATKEEVEQLGKDFAAVVGDINKALEELPTSEDIKDEMKELAKGLKQYSEKHFATKNEMRELFVHKHKTDQLVLSALKKDITEVKEQMPTQANPQGFAREAHVDQRVHALKQKQDALVAQLADKVDRSDLNGYPTKDDMQEMKGTIPTVENPQGFATKNDVDERVQALNEQLEDKADRSDLNGYATKKNIEGFVSQEAHTKTVSELQQQITALEKNSPKEQAKASVIYLAKQGALGCVSYRLAPYTASLLRALKLENGYVDLETVAVPTTTFAVSILARLAKERYEKGEESSLQNVAKESALDAGVSAGMMGLRYIFFDDQMNEYVEQMSETERTARYAGCYALLRSLVALFV